MNRRTGKPYFNGKSKTNLIQLTSRQQQILAKICEGKSYPAIAQELFISVPTVKYHVKKLFHNLNVHNKVQAVRIAITNKLI